MDLNRNWAHKWGASEARRSTEEYGGEAPLSEIESRILLDVAKVRASTLLHCANCAPHTASQRVAPELYVNVHSGIVEVRRAPTASTMAPAAHRMHV